MNTSGEFVNGGPYHCDGCLDPFVIEDGCTDLYWLSERRKDDSGFITPETRRLLRKHIRECWFCRVDIPPDGEPHYIYCRSPES